MTVAGAPSFLGRAEERASLDGLLHRVRGGESAALIIRGEAGIGKTALLQYCARQASGCRLAQIAGIESEFEMPFAALHQMCAPMLGELSALPEPQQHAVQVSFGLAAGSAPDRFVVGLAVLGLLAEVAAERPLVCLVDDAQWIDEPSRQVLGFVGRRLMAEAVLLLLAEMEIPNGTGWALIELIEAAVRNRQPEAARVAMEQLPKHTLEDSDRAMGVQARSRALVAEGDEAEQWYAEAVKRLARTPFRTELGRAHLLYGEWLRREGRRVDAREQLTRAYEMFSAMGAEAFAERARRERVATGEKVRKRDVSTLNELTPQEEHIARLARDGRSNAEIGAEMFLSVRTVEWHLRKVFIKLDVRSRKDLKDALPSRDQNAALTA